MRPTDADRDEAVAILSAAFASDPMFLRANPHPFRRAAALPLCWRAACRQTRRLKGWVELAERDGRKVGAALWLPGEDPGVGWLDTALDGYLRFGVVGGIRAGLTLMEMQAAATAKHEQLAPEPHWYLYALGVMPGWQGQGVGSELLERGLSRVDEQAVAAYLETNLPQNVRLYERHGFEVVGDQDNFGYHTWFMKRPAR